MSKYLELVEGSFTQEHFNKQKNQKPYVAYSIKDSNVIYTIIPNEEEEKYTIYRAINYVDISNCTYNTVDLGLPSGLKWADRNIGAKNPEHFGSYFQWGDPTPYTYVGEINTQELVDLLNNLLGGGVTVDNVKEVLASQGVTGNDLTEVVNNIPVLNREFNFNRDNYFDTTDGGNTFNKYNNNGGLTVLESSDDAAAVHTESQYRMPTFEEIEELINNTTHTFIDMDGNEYTREAGATNIDPERFKGVRLTGPNGNSIFIPAAGAAVADYAIYSKISLIWTSTLDERLPAVLAVVPDDITSNYVIYTSRLDRCTGLSVRGVGNSTKKYLTFKAEEDNSSIGLNMLSSSQTMEYSTDTVTWNTFDTTTNINLNNGDEVYIRGILNTINNMTDTTQFKMSGKIAAYGNCNALWNYEDLNAPLKEFCGFNMFGSCTSLTTAPELPATTLSGGCYMGMFRECTSLTTAPKLPATMLTSYCYTCMFQGCTSLATAPELPATTLADSCYQYMFEGCNNLNYIKCLATDISATDCTNSWVNQVASTGTFIKHPNMNNWTTSVNGIPSGWTVEDAVL